MESRENYAEVADSPLASYLQEHTTPLPDAGASSLLDDFCVTKHITVGSMVRCGARALSGREDAIVWVGPGRAKLRNLLTGDKRNVSSDLIEFDSSRMKIISAKSGQDSNTVILAEGETDSCWLSDHYIDVDIAMLPSGVHQTWKDWWTQQLSSYSRIVIALDNDAASIPKTTELLKLFGSRAVAMTPSGGKDWCEANPDPAPELPARRRAFVTAKDLRSMDVPDVLSFYEQAILPIAGQMVIHGWAKSYKSYMAFDLLSCMAQGEPWCTFEFTGGEPIKVGVIQYEIPFGYYQGRVNQLYKSAANKDLFDENFHTFNPLTYPELKAGNQAHLDALLTELDESEISVLLVDPIRQTLSGADLNSEKDVSQLRALVEPIKAAGVTVVLTHHDNKSASRQGGGDPLGMTGSGAFAGDADTIVSISVPYGLKVEDPHRNVNFTVRNGPAPSGRAMVFDDERLLYLPEPIDGRAEALAAADTEPDETTEI